MQPLNIYQNINIDLILASDQKCKNKILKEDKIDKKLKTIAEIQESINWNKKDYKIAARRLNNPEDLKFFLKKGKETVAYAILVSKEPGTWYLSQIAVNRTYQKKKYGTALMSHIFEQAKINNVRFIDVTMDITEQHLKRFYSSFANEKRTISFSGPEDIRYKLLQN